GLAAEVVLRQEAAHHLFLVRVSSDFREVIAAAEYRSIADEQHGDAVDAVLRGRSDDVDVLAVVARHQLLDLHRLDALYLVSVTRRLFIILLARRTFHSLDHRFNHASVFPFQEQDGRVDVFAICLAVYISDTRRGAALYLVLQTGPVSVAEIAVLATADEKQLLQLVHCLSHRTRIRIGAEIASLPRSCTAMELDAREFMIGRDVDVGIAFVVTQYNIEAWLVALDHVVFEEQRFGLRVRDGHVDSDDVQHQRGGLRVRMGSLEVTGNALPQVSSHAHVNDLALLIEHAVDTRPVAQAAEKCLRVEFCGLVL